MYRSVYSMKKLELNKGIIIECRDCYEVITINDSTENKEVLKELNICGDCLENNYFKCSCCNEYHEGSYEIEVEYLREYKSVCSDCVECYDDKFFYCDDCGNYKALEDYTQEEIYDVDSQEYIYMCDSCKDSDNYIFYCEYHERHEKTDNTLTINNYGEICFRAYEEGEFSYCQDCEEYYHVDDLEYSDEDDYLYCNECIGEHKGHIKSYHDHKCEYINNNKISDIEEPYNLTFGIELEVESKGHISCSEMANILYDNMNDFTVYETDGSLNNGFEIITVPFDNNYYEEEGKELLINMLDLLKENNFISHDTNTCGYHIHVGRHGLGRNYGERLNTIMNINLVCEYFKEELTLLSRRKESQLNRWANFLTSGINKENLTTDKVETLVKNNKQRYSAINLNNESTIEFRIFRGTLKKETFLATYELVYNICKYCIENDIIYTNDLDFYTIATYDKKEYIVDYLEAKGITKKEIKTIAY